METRIPFMLLSWNSTARAGKKFRSLGRLLLNLSPSLRQTLAKLRIYVEPEAYMVGAFFSSLIYGLFIFLIGMAALTVRGAEEPLRVSIAIGLTFWALFFLVHMAYPSILLKKIAIKENKDLLFALREMMIDVDGGVPLFDAMKNVSEADYGYISSDFEVTVKKIQGGVPEKDALRELALKTESEYLKRAAWQMVNALETGARMNDALTSIVQSAENYMYRDIKNYSANLNFLMLIYMLGAAVVPSLGMTFLVLLSAFSGLGVTAETMVMLVAGSVILQLILIGYMHSMRPGVFGG